MPPSDDYELNLFRSLEVKYQTLYADFDEDDRYLRGEFGTDIIPSQWMQDGLKVTRTTMLHDAINSAVDHILTDPKIAVPVRPTDRDVETERHIAEIKRQFHELWWARVFEDQGDPLGRARRPLIKGKIVLKLELDWELLPTLPEQPTRAQRQSFRRKLAQVGRSQFPWKLSVLPRKTVFEDCDHPEDPDYVFESFDITVHEATRRYPKLAERFEGRDPLEDVAYIEYWSRPRGSDRGEFIQWVEDERVHSGINPYSWTTPRSTDANPDWTGHTPYLIGDCGWGEVDARSDPFDRYVSLTRHLRNIYEAQTRQLTSVEAWLRLYIWRPVVTKNMSSEAEGEKPRELVPGSHWDITDDQSVEVLNFGDMPVAPFQFLQTVQAEADRHSKFGALSGVAQRGVDTATEADQNTRNAATSLSGPVTTLRRLVMRVNTCVEQHVEKVLEAPVTVYGATGHGPSEITLKPSDINGFYFTQVQLETADEAALNVRNLRVWGDVYSRFPLTARTAMTNAGIANAQGEIDERKIEDLEGSPQAMQVLLMLMLQALGDPGSVVGSAFQQALPGMQGGGGANANGSQPAEQPPAPNRVAQMRRESQQAAVENQPERALF